MASIVPPAAHIRERDPDDLGQLVAISRRVRSADRYPAYLPDNDFERFLTQPEPRAAWVAVEDRRIVGHVALNDETAPGAAAVVHDAGITAAAGFVARLVVDPSVRRTGIGRALLEHATAAAIAAGLVPVLDVVAEARKAIALYESAGWTRLGSAELALPDGTSVTELVYRGPTPG